MIAEQFEPLDIECLVRTAVELGEWATEADLSGRQQVVLARARAALLADDAGHEPLTPQRTVLVDIGQPSKVWILRRWDRSNEQVTLHESHEAGQAALAIWVRHNWDALGDESSTPPQDDEQAIQLYYGPQDERTDDDFRLYPEEVARRQPSDS